MVVFGLGELLEELGLFLVGGKELGGGVLEERGGRVGGGRAEGVLAEG